MFEPVDAAAFMIDREQRLNSRKVPKMAGEIVNLVETFDVSLKQQEAAGLDRIKKSTRFSIRFSSLKTDDKKLPYFLFKSEMRIPHWNQFGLPGLLFGFLFELGQEPQCLERGDRIDVDPTQSIPQLFFKGSEKR